MQEVSSPSGSSPAIGLDGTVYTGSWDGNLYALDPNSVNQDSECALKWTFTTDGSVWSSPVITPDGTVYVGSWDGNLYAVYDSSGGPADAPWPMFHHAGT
jgi:outer membrane protein assembly factor BamB